jgi:hypothetical protein
MNFEKPVGKTRFRTWCFPVCITFVLVITMIWANVYLRSARYAREGDDYLKDGHLVEAISSYETSAHAYTPWNPHVKHSMQKLWDIGELLEQMYDDPTYPLIAYRSLRSTVYAIRSFYTPYKEWVPRCNEKIMQLVEKQDQMIKDARRGSGGGK